VMPLNTIYSSCVATDIQKSCLRVMTKKNFRLLSLFEEAMCYASSKLDFLES